MAGRLPATLHVHVLCLSVLLTSILTVPPAASARCPAASPSCPQVYRGNLSAFVKAVPEAQSYYQLEATEQEWQLPEPGFLEGVKSKDKAILKMHNMSFQYPGAPKPQITGVSLQVSRRRAAGPGVFGGVGVGGLVLEHAGCALP